MSKQEKAFELFDSYNKQDPNSTTWEGVTYPTEYFFALQLYSRVKALNPAASEILLLASRAQHIGRWKSPRENYAMDKAGYYKWRTDLARFHADTAASLAKEAGYREDEVNALRSIILKENLKTNPDVQIIEDALCLVFLEFQYDDFLAKHDDEKMIRILKRSWNKMDHAGRDAATKLTYSVRGKELLLRALEFSK